MRIRWRSLAWPLLSTLLLASTSLLFAHTDIPASEAHAMILADEDLVVLDVREDFEFCGSVQHIEDAANLPWNSNVLQNRFGELPTDVNIIVTCASGGRSNQAANFLDAQGFTNIYDMQGGMNAWDWETEDCDPAPVVVMHKTSTGSEINWTPAHDEQSYDLIRGALDDVSDAGDFIDLGEAECLREDSPFTYYTDPDLPLSPFYYLARRVDGSWGASSDHEERTPASLSCQGIGF